MDILVYDIKSLPCEKDDYIYRWDNCSFKPSIDEQILIEGVAYIVSDVVFNYEENLISLFVFESNGEEDIDIITEYDGYFVS